MGKPVLLEIQRQAHAQFTMNLCIFSFQAALFAVLLVQYHYINEVEAVKITRDPNGNWFNSVEKRIETFQDMMKEAYQEFKDKANAILANYRSFMRKDARAHHQYNKDTSNEKYENNEGFKIDDLFQSYEENKDLLATYDVTDYITSEENAADPEKDTQVVLEQQEAPKRKKKLIKKHKKKNRTKHVQREHTQNEREHIQNEREHNIQNEREHIQNEREHNIQNEREQIQHEHHEYVTHVPHEQRLDASVDQEKEEYDGKKVLRKDHRKREKHERFNQRKFVKTYTKESNSSESDEVKRRKPVDIIVHIKMND